MEIISRTLGGMWKFGSSSSKHGLVLAEMEYEESPRGRVMFNTKTNQFTLLADRCILKDGNLVKSCEDWVCRKQRKSEQTITCARCSQAE